LTPFQPELTKPPQSGLKPPEGFRGARDILWAHLVNEAPQFARAGSRRGARGRGIRYEERTHVALTSRYGESYVASPWILFCEPGARPRYCQPDGWHIDIEAGKLNIIEIKYNHTSAAYWKLFGLYLPATRALFGPDWVYTCVEVVRWYDPATYGPMDATLRRNIHEAREGEWAVHILNERGG